MRNLRQLCATSFLTMIITTSAFAGDMQTPGITAPPPDQQPPVAAVAGQTDTTLISDAGQAAGIALTLLANALSVF